MVSIIVPRSSTLFSTGPVSCSDLLVMHSSTVAMPPLSMSTGGVSGTV